MTSKIIVAVAFIAFVAAVWGHGFHTGSQREQTKTILKVFQVNEERNEIANNPVSVRGLSERLRSTSY